jgi:hypothetical protein
MPNSDWATSATPASATRTTTDVLGGAALPTNVSHFGALANATGWLKNDGAGNFTYTLTQTGLGTTLASTHCGATYTATEQGLINALIDKVVLLETKLKAFGIVAT